MQKMLVALFSVVIVAAFSGAIILARETKKTLVCGEFASAKLEKRQALGVTFNVVNVRLSDGRQIELEGIPRFSLEKGRTYSFLLRANRRHGNDFLLSAVPVGTCKK